MGPTEVLIREHEVIAKGLAVLHEMADRLERGQSVSPDSALGLIDFFAAYADQHHHSKEETLLFPALVAAGLPAEHGPVAVMLHEHQLGRALIAQLRVEARRQDGPGAPRSGFIAAARDYCALLGGHIHKENAILFRLAEEALFPEQSSALSAAFERIEEDAAARPGHQAQLRAIDELGRIFLGPLEGPLADGQVRWST